MVNNKIMKVDDLPALINNEIMEITAVSNKYGIASTFVTYNGHDPSDPKSGLYFIVCPDKATLDDLMYNVKAAKNAIIDNYNSAGDLCCYCAAYPLMDVKPVDYLKVHSDMYKLVHDMTMVKSCYNEFGFDLPDRVTPDIINNLYKYSEKRKDLDYPPYLRDRYNEALKNYVTSTYHMLYDIQHSKKDIVHTIPFHPHEVKKDFFLKNNIPAIYKECNEGFYHWLKDNVNEHNIDFYFCTGGKRMTQANLADNKITGPNYFADQTGNYKYSIGFPQSSAHTYARLAITYNCKDCCNNIPFSDLKNMSCGQHCFRINLSDLNNFDILCHNNNVKYAIDLGDCHGSDDSYLKMDDIYSPTVIYRDEDKEMVGKIVGTLMHSQQDYIPVYHHELALGEQNKPKERRNPYVDREER